MKLQVSASHQDIFSVMKMLITSCLSDTSFLGRYLAILCFLTLTWWRESSAVASAVLWQQVLQWGPPNLKPLGLNREMESIPKKGALLWMVSELGSGAATLKILQGLSWVLGWERGGVKDSKNPRAAFVFQDGCVTKLSGSPSNLLSHRTEHSLNLKRLLPRTLEPLNPQP